MRRAFTLVELLVVVVVIVTLMAVTFRLGSAGSGHTARARTVSRMQRLENCLSGYYAAYGSYPPVALHGSRNYRYAVTSLGIQRDADSEGGEKFDDSKISNSAWARVEAACRSQPVGMSHPFTTKGAKTYVEKVSDVLKTKAGKDGYSQKLAYGFDALTDKNQISGAPPCAKWTQAQIFRLGLLSYLLPRLLVACPSSGAGTDYVSIYTDYDQWRGCNEVPCDLANGQPYGGWKGVFDALQSKSERWKIAALPSQAACARWMPNLEDIVSGGGTYYGVDTSDKYFGAQGVTIFSKDPPIRSVNENSQQYLLDEKTVLDGWGREFYYYSPAPHQSYTLWSAGSNGKTFPPWVPEDEMRSMGEGERSVVQEWVADDIIHMSN
ncbi:MAG: type II secretion system protein GspG [Kiritimatiellae bacterium]|nr:type II secretion system protein GspG [Kiritimatiellia bacterium]